MTRESYLDMCEQLNSEPIEDEIPIEIEDFQDQVKEAWTIYSYLPDRVDSFSGSYYGKSIESIANLFELFDIEIKDRILVLKLVMLFDKYETEQITKKLANKAKK